jgi:hypothetical protein
MMNAPKINTVPIPRMKAERHRRRDENTPDAAMTMNAAAHQSGGRHLYTPVAIPAAKDRAAHSSGWRPPDGC